jgi:2-dehydro-3-deoxygluconokinase
MKPQNIFVVGECMIELRRANTGLTYRFGGDTLNAAVYLSRLINRKDFEVAYVTALGVDSLSEEMNAGWENEGINTSWVQRLPDKLPGMYLIETDAAGERRFHYWRSDSAARYWLQGDRAEQVCDALANSPFVYLSGISLAILSPSHREILLSTLTECRSRGGKIIFDNNYRPRLWQCADTASDMYRRILSLTDIALLTLDDEDALYGKADVATVIERTRALGVAEVVIKRSAASCIVEADGRLVEVTPQQVASVVDTTAAGDSFGAAYVAARLAGRTPEQAAHAGHRLAAAVIQIPGAIIPLEKMPK